jgi:hypothetical protein
MNRAALTDTERRVRANERLVRKALAIGFLQRGHETVGILPLALVDGPEFFAVLTRAYQGCQGPESGGFRWAC